MFLKANYLASPNYTGRGNKILIGSLSSEFHPGYVSAQFLSVFYVLSLLSLLMASEFCFATEDLCANLVVSPFDSMSVYARDAQQTFLSIQETIFASLPDCFFSTIFLFCEGLLLGEFWTGTSSNKVSLL